MNITDTYNSVNHTNWFYEKYYLPYHGANMRYWTFQLALNLLLQGCDNARILETGCQRQKDDVGAGMSTSIFGEFVCRNGGHLTTVDLIPKHLQVCRECTTEFSSRISYVESDSVTFLARHDGQLDLLYLDSIDYPLDDNEEQKKLSQDHCLAEFRVIEPRLNPSCLVLIDDNTMPGGGKPRLLKEYLASKHWSCLLDNQQSLWAY